MAAVSSYDALGVDASGSPELVRSHCAAVRDDASAVGWRRVLGAWLACQEQLPSDDLDRAALASPLVGQAYAERMAAQVAGPIQQMLATGMLHAAYATAQLRAGSPQTTPVAATAADAGAGHPDKVVGRPSRARSRARELAGRVTWLLAVVLVWAASWWMLLNLPVGPAERVAAAGLAALALVGLLRARAWAVIPAAAVAAALLGRPPALIALAAVAAGSLWLSVSILARVVRPVTRWARERRAARRVQRAQERMDRFAQDGADQAPVVDATGRVWDADAEWSAFEPASRPGGTQTLSEGAAEVADRPVAAAAVDEEQALQAAQLLRQGLGEFGVATREASDVELVAAGVTALAWSAATGQLLPSEPGVAPVSGADVEVLAAAAALAGGLADPVPPSMLRAEGGEPAIASEASGIAAAALFAARVALFAGEQARFRAALELDRGGARCRTFAAALRLA